MIRGSGATHRGWVAPLPLVALAAALLQSPSTPLAGTTGAANDFLRAVRLADARGVDAYLAAGGDPGVTDRNGRPALHVAVRHGHIAIAHRLLAGKAGVDARDADGWTALHFAAENGDLEVLSLLLAAGADATAVDAYRYAPLHLAAREGHAAACDLLIAAGADPRAPIDVGFTAADLAEQYPALQDRLRALEQR